MRRAEFDVKDKTALENLLAECGYGTLSLVDGSEPYGVPVNFVYFDGAICIHGARGGRKAEAIAKNPKASFSVARAYSLIPSYFSDTKAACPATQFFASVHISGKIELVEDTAQKCDILNAMMQKLQSDGGYETITTTNPIYTKMLTQTAVWRLTPSHATMKVKAGQNLTEERKADIVAKLCSRGGDRDADTAELITAQASIV